MRPMALHRGLAPKVLIVWAIVVPLIISFVSYKIYLSEYRLSVVWNENLGAAQQQANTSDGLLLIEFGAKWCGPCQRMKTTTLFDDSLAQSLRKYVLVSIDVDMHPELAGQLDVETIPQFFIVNSRNGKVLKENRVGFMPAEDFLAWLNADNDPSLNEVFPNFGDQPLPTTR